MFYIVVLFGILTVLYNYVTRHHDKWEKLHVPYAAPLFFYGNIKDVVLQKRSVAYAIDDIYNLFKCSGWQFIGMFSLRSPRFLILAPSLIKDIFIGKFHNFHDNEYHRMVDEKTDPIIARNPFMLTGDAWKEKRAEVTPAFTPSRIKALYPLMIKACNDMTEYLKKDGINNLSDGIEAKELSAKFTIDVFSSSIFALDAKSFHNNENSAIIRKMASEIFGSSIILHLKLTILFLFPWILNFYKIRLVPQHIEEFFTNLMDNAVNYRRSKNIQRTDYLDHLLHLESKKKISITDMAAHGVSFFIDGFDTTSGVLSYALYEIAKNLHVQRKLRKEINNNLDANGIIPYGILIELEYMDHVISETLRLHPPILLISRLCTEETAFDKPDGGFVQVKKGDKIAIPVYSIHRNPEYYSNPDTFDPERFLIENGGSKSFEDKGVFIPFSNGPRSCLGRRFALVQIKCALTEIIKNFEISISNKTQEPLIIDPKKPLNTPIGGIWLNFLAIKH